MKTLSAITLLLLGCSGCAVVSVTGSVLSTTVSVAGTAISAGVGVAGSAVRGVASAVSSSSN